MNLDVDFPTLWLSVKSENILLQLIVRFRHSMNGFLNPYLIFGSHIAIIKFKFVVNQTNINHNHLQSGFISFIIGFFAIINLGMSNLHEKIRTWYFKTSASSFYVLRSRTKVFLHSLKRFFTSFEWEFIRSLI